MSSTNNTPPHFHGPVGMDEEKISIDSLKLSLESSGDFSSKPKSPSIGEGKETCPKISQGSSLHSVATALTNLVKTSKADDVSQGDEKSEDFEIPLRFTKSGRKRAVPFPLKLMKVLSQAEFTDIITWLPDGKSFTILKPKAFVTEILSKESGLGFKQAKYSSFTRKLHRWGFMRHYRGEEAGAFYHKLFVRDRLDWVEKMTCNKVEPPKYASTITNDHRPSPKPKPSSAALSSAKHASKPSSAATSTLPRAGAVAEHLRQAPRQPMMANVPIRQRASMPMSQSMADNLATSSERLNAAIEMEVARRLKERITAAALTRHALAMMQQQIVPSNAPLPNFRDSSGLAWNSAAAAALQRRAAAAAAGNQIPLGSLNLNPMMMVKSRPMLNHPGAGMVGLRMPNSLSAQQKSMFQSNIEGAKTA